jgi:hypothetical protein
MRVYLLIGKLIVLAFESVNDIPNCKFLEALKMLGFHERFSGTKWKNLPCRAQRVPDSEKASKQ